MPIYRVQAPDGAILRILGPDDATEEELTSAASEQWNPKAGLSPEQIAEHANKAAKTLKKKTTLVEDIAASAPGRFITGLGEPAFALGEMIPGPVGEWSRDQVSRLRDLQERGKSGRSGVENVLSDVGGISGNMTMLAPAMQGIPMLSGAQGVLPRLAQYAGNVGIGAGTGAITGSLVPTGKVEDYGSRKLEQAQMGGMFGGAVSAVSPAITGLGNWIVPKVSQVADLMSSKGSERIAKNYLATVTGDNSRKLAYELNRAKELTPGSVPTASQVVAHLPEGSPIQAHQKIIAEEGHKGISALFGKRIAEQQAAREAQLAFAGTEDDLVKLITERTNAVTPLYEAVKTSTAAVRSAPVLTKINSLINENPNKTSIAAPLKQLREKLIIETQKGMRIENNPQALKSLSDEISDMMGKKTIGGANEFDVKALREIKEILDKQLGLAVPEYRKALDLFAEKSKPINTMKVGQALKDKLTNPTGAETPGVYLRALENEKKLLKESIGFGRTSVEKILSPQEMKAVESVAADLERTVAAKNPLQPTNLRGGVNVANETTLSLPQMLYRPAMIANYVLKGLGRNVEPEIDAYFARLYLNPKELGKVLAQIDPAKREAFNKIIQERGRVVASGLAGNIGGRVEQ